MTEYHWIMTVEWPVGAGRGVNTSHGTTIVAPGESRGDVLQRLFAFVQGQSPAPNGANILFFSLEPNQLVAA